MTSDRLSRLFGGPPLWVVFRLALISVLVGMVLAALGLDVRELLYSLQRLFRSVLGMGWDTVDAAWRYFLLGAVIVVPVWALSRVLKATPPRRSPAPSPKFRDARPVQPRDHQPLG